MHSSKAIETSIAQCTCQNKCKSCRNHLGQATIKSISQLFDEPKKAYARLLHYVELFKLGPLEIANMELHFQAVKGRRSAQGIWPAMPVSVIDDFFALLATK